MPELKGVAIQSRDDLEIVSVLARKGQHAALGTRLQERFGIVLPEGPRLAAGKNLSLLGVGPGSWLAMREPADPALITQFRGELGGLASVCDQSDAYAVQRISGPNVRGLLGKLIPIDVHARAFKIGDVAVTQASHIGVALWRRADDPDGSSVFEIAVYRSYAASFRRALVI